MSVYLVRRLLATIPVMGVVALFVFGLLHLTPGDPAAIIAGDYATAEDIARIHTQLGLDRPLHVQFVAWLGQILRGDLGTSIFSRRPVAEQDVPALGQGGLHLRSQLNEQRLRSAV